MRPWGLEYNLVPVGLVVMHTYRVSQKFHTLFVRLMISSNIDQYTNFVTVRIWRKFVITLWLKMRCAWWQYYKFSPDSIWQWKKFEDWSTFNEVRRRTKVCRIFATPCRCATFRCHHSCMKRAVAHRSQRPTIEHNKNESNLLVPEHSYSLRPWHHSFFYFIDY